MPLWHSKIRCLVIVETEMGYHREPRAANMTHLKGRPFREGSFDLSELLLAERGGTSGPSDSMDTLDSSTQRRAAEDAEANVRRSTK